MERRREVSPGGAGALALGFAMLPLTVIGLIVAVGALGFLPFATAGVFFSNASRALWSADEGPFTTADRAALFGCGMLSAGVFPLAFLL